MDRAIDEIILGLLCLPVAYFSCSSSETVTAALLCVCLACAHVLLPGDGEDRSCRVSLTHAQRRLRRAGHAARALIVAVLIAGAFAWKPVAAFCPVAAYLAFSSFAGAARLTCALPPLAPLRFGDAPFAFALCFLCVVAYLMAWRTGHLTRARHDTRTLRDQLQESSLALAQRNRSLIERHDFEVRRAVLEERARIAREIHDNVGHLLTRAVLQVEALRVVHGADVTAAEEQAISDKDRASSDSACSSGASSSCDGALAAGASSSSLSAGLAAVGATLGEALGTVRASVHDLHDDAFDARVQLERVVESWEGDARLSYEAAEIPPEIAYALVAVVREALSNASRHGGATAVRVRVADYPGFYQLVVKDNGARNHEHLWKTGDEGTVCFAGAAPSKIAHTGCGPLEEANDGKAAGTVTRRTARTAARPDVPPSDGASAAGMGIRSMRERIEGLGGTFTAHAEAGRGFIVFASVPKPGRDAGDESEAAL